MELKNFYIIRELDKTFGLDSNDPIYIDNDIYNTYNKYVELNNTIGYKSIDLEIAFYGHLPKTLDHIVWWHNNTTINFTIYNEEVDNHNKIQIKTILTPYRITLFPLNQIIENMPIKDVIDNIVKKTQLRTLIKYLNKKYKIMQ